MRDVYLPQLWFELGAELQPNQQKMITDAVNKLKMADRVVDLSGPIGYPLGSVLFLLGVGLLFTACRRRKAQSEPSERLLEPSE